MHLTPSKATVITTACTLFICSSAHAEGPSKQDLAKAAQNPIANMISLPLQNNVNTGIGPDDETQNILNIQPVYPFSLGDDWTVPVGGRVGKIMKWGKLPVNGQISAYNNVESPENGADWQFRIQLQFLFPK